MRKYKYIYKKENSPNWYYRFYINNKEVRGSTGTTNQREAYKIALLKKTQITNEIKNPNKFKGKTWEDARDRWVDTRKNWNDQEQYRLNWFNKELKGKKISNIDADLVFKLQQKQLKSGLKPQTVDRNFSQLRSILKLSYKIGWVKDIPFIERVGIEVERHREITKEEKINLFANLPDHLIDPIKFYLQTGLRKNELVNLKWEQVDLKKKRIRFKENEQKNNTFDYVPLSQKAIEILNNNKGKHPTLVFAGKSKVTGGLGDFKKAWKLAKQKSGIEDLRIHDLRHDVGSTLAEEDVSEAYIASVLRHKDTKTTRKYIKARDAKLLEIVELLH